MWHSLGLHAAPELVLLACPNQSNMQERLRSLTGQMSPNTTWVHSSLCLIYKEIMRVIIGKLIPYATAAKLTMVEVGSITRRGQLSLLFSFSKGGVIFLFCSGFRGGRDLTLPACSEGDIFIFTVYTSVWSGSKVHHEECKNINENDLLNVKT